MLDAHQMNVFLAAAKTLNFTTAARQLNMTQPSVSQHIHALEQHFGTSLFTRSGRNLSLTDAGLALLPLAQRMVSLSVQIDETMESLKGEVHGHLLVGCTTTPGRYILPSLLANFLRRYPRVEATCHVTTRRNAVEMLREGELHVALAGVNEFSRDVEFRNLYSEPVVFIVPRDHPWAECDFIEPQALFEANFILREEGSGTRAVVAEGLAQAGISLDDFQPVLTLGSSEAIALSVQEGIGVGFVSQMVVTRLVQEGVTVVRIAGLDLEQKIYMGRHARHPATNALQAFWSFVFDTTEQEFSQGMPLEEHIEDSLLPVAPLAQ